VERGVLDYVEGLGIDSEVYGKAVSRKDKCMRANTLKIREEELLKRLPWKYEEVPWIKHAYRIECDKPGNSVEHALGYFFVQDPAAMLPAKVLMQDERKLTVSGSQFPARKSGTENPRTKTQDRGFRILDLCAAPGAKTTQLAQLMNNKGSLIANDTSTQRSKALAMNVQRCGCLNTVVTNTDGKNFLNWLPGTQDYVLVDAPCSGLGQRNAEMISQQWKLKKPTDYTKVQTDLITTGFGCLKPGGRMVYSTCTLTVEENEIIVKTLLNTFDNARLKTPELRLKFHKGIGLKECVRIYPQDNNTDGQFIALIEKE